MEKEQVVRQNEHRILDQTAFDRIDSSLAEAILNMSRVVITARPLIRWGEPATYYNDNKTETDIWLRPSYLRMMRIPEVGHAHLDQDFIGEYPAINGFEVETGVEYLFGIKQELDFDYYVPSSGI